MKPVCILGNGQLGRMLRQAGEPLGIAVYPVGLDAEPEAVPYQHAVITAEIERWPDTPLTEILARHPGFVNRDVFPLLADRLTQKRLLDTLKLATSLAASGKTRAVARSLSVTRGACHRQAPRRRLRRPRPVAVKKRRCKHSTAGRLRCSYRRTGDCVSRRSVSCRRAQPSWRVRLLSAHS